MKNKAAVILSGCGYKEGSEIHETVLSYLAMAEAGISYHSFSIEKMLNASAPIARDQISPLTTLNEKDYDLLWMPGGLGVVKNLTTFAQDGPNCTVNPEVRRVIEEFHKAGKPIIAVCIAPVAIAKVLEGQGIQMTLGTNKKDCETLKTLGMNPVVCKVDEYCFDKKHNIYTTPGYMEPSSITGIYRALQKIAKNF